MSEQTLPTGQSLEGAACQAMIQLASILHRAVTDGKKITVTCDSPIVVSAVGGTGTFGVKNPDGSLQHWKPTGKVIFKVVVEPVEPDAMADGQ